MASFFVAALDGMAIQRSLGVYPAKEEMVIETFIEFFQGSHSSIPGRTQRIIKTSA